MNLDEETIRGRSTDAVFERGRNYREEGRIRRLDRFVAELERAADWIRPLPVVVETSWETLLRGRGCVAWRDVHPNQIVGTVPAWTRGYNVDFRFTENRRRHDRLLGP